jgi:hypothetical protein
MKKLFYQREWADQQHAWMLAGDDRGVYGDFTPTRID